jgi:N-acetylglucosaminyl-diphospho-decaprenol L-rhamnosyltransferase
VGPPLQFYSNTRAILCEPRISCQRARSRARLFGVDLSIVILNWNVADLLAACLRSLPDACGAWWPRTEVIVVDNASTDDSVAIVRAGFPDVRLILLPANQGFTRGNNAGIGAATGDYILLLNPDTVAQRGSIAALCDYMGAHPEVGIAGPRLLNPDGTLQPSRRRFPTIATALVESTPLQRFFQDSRILGRFYMADQPEDEEQYVDWVSGAALICRRETLAQVGPFDPGFFMFSEEVDLCRRATEAGWRVAYVPQARITHYGGGSTGQAVPSRHIHFNTSKARYFRVHEGRVVGRLIRLYLLTTYVGQAISEGAKWLLGHKRAMRTERLRMYAQVLQSGLRASHQRSANDNPRVMLITGEFPPDRGGVGDYTCKLSLALQDRHVEAKVLTGRWTVDGGRWTAKNAELPTTNYQLPTTVHRPPSTVHRPARISLKSALRALKNTGAKVAHVQYQTGAYEMRPTINMLPLLLRLLWGRPTVVTFHDLLVPYLFPKAGSVREWANRLLARTATAVIATNPDDANRLQSWGVRRLELIPIGSNIRNDPPPGFDRQAWRAALGVSPNTTLLAYFGFLNSTKGLDSLLRAISNIEKRAPGRYRLMMVGGGLGSSDPTNRATAGALAALARDLGVADSLTWTGYLEPQEVSAALLSADIAVLPFADGASFRRGSLLAVLEHGLPLITTRGWGPGIRGQGPAAGDQRSGVPSGNPKSEIRNPKSEIPDPRSLAPALLDNENALLVPPGDEAALVLAIEWLAGDDALRLKLAGGALNLARYFSWETIAERHALLYNDLVSDGRL